MVRACSVCGLVARSRGPLLEGPESSVCAACLREALLISDEESGQCVMCQRELVVRRIRQATLCRDCIQDGLEIVSASTPRQ